MSSCPGVLAEQKIYVWNLGLQYVYTVVRSSPPPTQSVQRGPGLNLGPALDSKSVEILGSKIWFSSILETFPTHQTPKQSWFFYFLRLYRPQYLNNIEWGVRVSEVCYCLVIVLLQGLFFGFFGFHPTTETNSPIQIQMGIWRPWVGSHKTEYMTVWLLCQLFLNPTEYWSEAICFLILYLDCKVAYAIHLQILCYFQVLHLCFISVIKFNSLVSEQQQEGFTRCTLGL